MTDNAKAAVVWLLISVCWLALILLLWGLDITPAAADDDGGFDYSEQQHQGAAVPGDGLDGCVVAELETACVPIPAAMFKGVAKVQACESGGWWSKAATPRQLVSPNGLYYGSLQLDKRHGAAMTTAGLDWGSDADRVRWGVLLWERWGWSLWPHCGKLG